MSKRASEKSVTRRIAVVVNNVGGYSRGVLRGVASYANARAWACRVQGVNEERIERTLADFDGLIIQAATREQASMLGEMSVPAVNVSSALGLKRVPSVVSDDLAVGRLGADYFVRRGYRHFAFFATDDRQFAILRHEGFRDRLRESSHDLIPLPDEAGLAAALAAAPGPLAVMAANDRAALAVLDAARGRSLRVPEDVAVLGVDDDELMQSLAYPPLSSINTARDRIGFEAAAMLEKLMNRTAARTAAPTAVVKLQPRGVITRRSTDALAIDDAEIVEAARFVHAHAGRPIGVSDVATAAGLSRRQLERRFADALGRSVHDEILRCRLDRARQLLLDTELTLPQVALASGFSSASYFSVVFKQQTGSTPQAFRTRLRAGV